ncbi:hypothetical protein AVEN_181319-1 [Araneus ventricosus]|uniref:Uncharacterized protein n=1 Tax=Araneus ventricosus TaxID=182803 RepID=A0A4Y2EJH0_ARAVE|nr:hypothetical protein AVEN_181319-1 [Araneus ventricosus]
MWVFGSPNAPVLLVDKAIEVKICLVREPYVSNIDITLIHKLQLSVREIIACINGIHTQGLARLDLVGEYVRLWRMTWCMIILRSPARDATKRTDVRGCCRMTCCTASTFDSVTALWPADISNMVIIGVTRSFEFFEQSLYRIV